jgi:hypothetical protein
MSNEIKFNFGDSTFVPSNRGKDIMNSSISSIASNLIQPMITVDPKVQEKIAFENELKNQQAIQQADADAKAKVIADGSPFSQSSFANSYVGNNNGAVLPSRDMTIRPTNGTRAERNFNPGNITGAGGKLLYGSVGFDRDNRPTDVGDRTQLQFATPDDGLRAVYSLSSGSRYNNEPINKAFAKYQSDQNVFASKLKDASNSGVDINKTFNEQSPEGKASWLNLTTRWEGWHGKQVSPEMIQAWSG